MKKIAEKFQYKKLGGKIVKKFGERENRMYLCDTSCFCSKERKVITCALFCILNELIFDW